MWEVSKSADSEQTRRRRRGGWSESTLFAYVRRSLFAWRWPYMYIVYITKSTWHLQQVLAQLLLGCIFFSLYRWHLIRVHYHRVYLQSIKMSELNRGDNCLNILFWEFIITTHVYLLKKIVTVRTFTIDKKNFLTSSSVHINVCDILLILNVQSYAGIQSLLTSLSKFWI